VNPSEKRSETWRLIFIQPCVENEDLLMGEALLESESLIEKNKKNIIKIKDLNEILHSYKPNISELRFFRKYGFISFRLQHKKIIITQFGRIIIRKAVNTEDLKDSIEFIIQILKNHNLISKFHK